MSSEIKLRQPGKRVFERPKTRLTLVEPAEQPPAPKPEIRPEVREMLREMNRRRSVSKDPDTPDAA